MIHFSLFSGIGGFDLASEWMGWDNYLSCEIEDFPNEVLNYYWPDAYHHRDIKNLDYDTIQNQLTRRFGEWRTKPVILTGGFPCQPYSQAGQRKGKEDERHLWPEMLRLIHEIKPEFIVGENVFGLLNWNGGMVFNEVLTDLGSAGYDVTPLVIPAAAVNAPHGRDRVWFVAYSSSNANGLRAKRGLDMDGELLERRKRQKKTNGFNDISKNGDATNTDGIRLEHTTRNGLQCKRQSTKLERERFSFNNAQNNQTTWQNFPTQSPICGGDDGLPTELDGITFSKWRNQSIKGYGNAIVPQVAYEIFKAIELAYSEITK